MRAFVTGATGVLGRRLVDELTDRGHEVVGLSRDADGDRVVADRGGEPRRGDVLDEATLVDAARDADVVVHAATAIPTTDRPTEADWERNDRVRLDGARNLLAAAAEAGAAQFVLPSVVWVARQPDGSAFDEDAEPNPDRTTQSALDAERLVREAADRHGFDATVLRFGFFYAPDAAHTRGFGRDLLAGDLPVVGGGLLGRADATVSFVHADDAATATAEAVEAGLAGRYHVVDEEPVAFGAVLSALADRLDAPEPGRVPGWLARFFVGREMVRTLTSPTPTSADRFREATGWEPDYPTYREGLDQVVETWLDEGTVAETREGYEWRADR